MKDPNKVLNICKRMLDANVPRQHNQAMLNLLFNGGPPWTEAECQADHHHTNVNFLEGTQKLMEARSQAINALKSPDQYFTVKIDTGSPHIRQELGTVITNEINRIMKLSRPYANMIESQVANMVLGGIGTVAWPDRDSWCPTPRRYDDILIPDETFTDLSNLNHFCLRTRFTISDLLKVYGGDMVDKGWNQDQLKQAIEALKMRGLGTDNTQYFYDPEKLVEDWKQNSIYYASDALPVLHCFDFYYWEQDRGQPDKGKWHRRVIVDTVQNSFQNYSPIEYLYINDDIPYGENPLPDQIFHPQIADGASVAPFRWHSVRSLGYLLYAICHLQNRLRCRYMDATFESMNWLFWDVSEADRETIQKVDIRHLGVIPTGLKSVPANERHNIDFELVSGAMAMNRQLMSEHSSSYNQNIDNGTQKERTAYEVATLSNDANRLITSMLSRIYEQQVPQYREICRRFCTTDHPDCIEFRKRVLADGVPKEALNVDYWTIVPEKVLGGGNKMIQMAQSGQLMSQYEKFNPRGQQIILHSFVETVTSDAALAAEVAPLDAQMPSPTAEKATLAWATLIDAKPVVLTGDVNRQEFVEETLSLLSMEFMEIDQSGQPPTPKRLMGIQNVINTVGQIVSQLQMDKSNALRVRGYAQALGNAQNKVKEYAKVMQAQGPQNGSQVDPAILGDIQAKQIKAESDAHINEAKAMQKLQHGQLKFEQNQQQNAAKTASEIHNQAARTQVEIAGQVARNRVQADSVQDQTAE